MRLAAVVVWVTAAVFAFAEQCAHIFVRCDSVGFCCPGNMGKKCDIKPRKRRTRAEISAAAQAQASSDMSSSTAMRAFVITRKGGQGRTVARKGYSGKYDAGSGESGAMVDDPADAAADDTAHHTEEAVAAAEPGVSTNAKGARLSGKMNITSDQAARIAENRARALEKLDYNKKKLAASQAGGSSQQGAVSVSSGIAAVRSSNDSDHPWMVGEEVGNELKLPSSSFCSQPDFLLRPRQL